MTGKNEPLRSWGSAARHHRPSWSASAHGARSVRRCGRRCAHKGRHRSARSPRARSALATRPAPSHGSDPRRHRHGTPRAARTGQTGVGLSVDSSSMCAWPFTPKISPMAPSRTEPRRPTQTHHSTGRHPASSLRCLRTICVVPPSRAPRGRKHDLSRSCTPLATSSRAPRRPNGPR